MATTPRKTAAQKRAEYEAQQALEQAAMWAEFTKTYPTRFAAVLHFYATNDHAGFTVEPNPSGAYVFKREDSYRQFTHLPVTPPATYTYSTISDLEDVERDMNNYLAELAEQKRRYEVKEAALVKVRSLLNDEERELLNLR